MPPSTFQYLYLFRTKSNFFFVFVFSARIFYFTKTLIISDQSKRLLLAKCVVNRKDKNFLKKKEKKKKNNIFFNFLHDLNHNQTPQQLRQQVILKLNFLRKLLSTNFISFLKIISTD